ncbi:hypothetical protein LCGC14_2020300 [marine sediment metagenome]|uniref:Uncharacterized protein n=1 Tax=marine sediment metagenome TaxID=412755 RepID=A0A0F9EY03_9ZZZZ
MPTLTDRKHAVIDRLYEDIAKFYTPVSGVATMLREGLLKLSLENLRKLQLMVEMSQGR